MFELKGMLSLHAGERHAGGVDRIELLAAIGETGSISAAARAVGMSYKGAWDAIDAINNLSDEPLVTRATGGKRGGGTRLTPRGQRLVEVFRQMAQQHERFVQQLGELGAAAMQDIQLMRRFTLRTSARNQLVGTVVALESGAANDAVTLALAGGQQLVATITRQSTHDLGLALGRQAIALIKASALELIGVDPATVPPAPNRLIGMIASIERSTVSAEVAIDLHGGGALVATVSEAAAQPLAVGQAVLAVVDASSVLLGTTD
ncbi:TOBE domain-containing protein [Dyella sp.]|jgi:molybdate transport system regulatory protein|uniref:TOBE domain-containing protein n=1 Tax=Dyella sp. TaxID=1869338 RepID=UPI002D788BB5|nr:TOBE domain-containing protein [Dyella sp.]HET6432814.1 TOBE domain-containing protein [Dyella sp.]